MIDLAVLFKFVVSKWSQRAANTILNTMAVILKIGNFVIMLIKLVQCNELTKLCIIKHHHFYVCHPYIHKASYMVGQEPGTQSYKVNGYISATTWPIAPKNCRNSGFGKAFFFHNFRWGFFFRVDKPNYFCFFKKRQHFSRVFWCRGHAWNWNREQHVSTYLITLATQKECLRKNRMISFACSYMYSLSHINKFKIYMASLL